MEPVSELPIINFSVSPIFIDFPVDFREKKRKIIGNWYR